MSQSNKEFDNKLGGLLESLGLPSKEIIRAPLNIEQPDECMCDDVIENGICGMCGEVVECDPSSEYESNYER